MSFLAESELKRPHDQLVDVREPHPEKQIRGQTQNFERSSQPAAAPSDRMSK